MEDFNSEQEQIHGILFGKEIGWQEIIYDLINSEQLDPWNIDITILSEKYLSKIQEIEEADFFVSSKVLLAASLLLRIKSEILLNRYIKSIDEILFGKKEKVQTKLEKIEFEDEIPELIPKSPIPRFKRVTLKELMEALNKAITTETRRIKKEIVKSNVLRESSISLPKKTSNLKDKIEILLSKLKTHFDKGEKEKKISYDNLTGEKREEKLSNFVPLLHLETQKKVWLHQKEHFEEIHIWERKNFWEVNGDPFKELKETEIETEE